MELTIRTRNFELTDAIREHVTRRLELALDAFGQHVEDVHVYLADLNGPKGGVDKLAQISVKVRRDGEIAVRETGTTLYAAINRAIRRTKYRVAETIRAGEAPARESIRTAEAA